MFLCFYVHASKSWYTLPKPTLSGPLEYLQLSCLAVPVLLDPQGCWNEVIILEESAFWGPHHIHRLYVDQWCPPPDCNPQEEFVCILLFYIPTTWSGREVLKYWNEWMRGRIIYFKALNRNIELEEIMNKYGQMYPKNCILSPFLDKINRQESQHVNEVRKYTMLRKLTS